MLSFYVGWHEKLAEDNLSVGRWKYVIDIHKQFECFYIITGCKSSLCYLVTYTTFTKYVGPIRAVVPNYYCVHRY